jgi:predicted dehydrogenase
VGCGAIADLKYFPALQKQKARIELVAFCDLIEELAQTAAIGHGNPGAKVYADYRKLVADPSIDAVHVLTPNVSHAEITVAALLGGKHVLCEKLMAANSSDAKKMLDAAKKSGKN